MGRNPLIFLAGFRDLSNPLLSFLTVFPFLSTELRVERKEESLFLGGGGGVRFFASLRPPTICDPEVTEQKKLWCIPFPREKKGKRVHTIGLERVYTMEAPD